MSSRDMRLRGYGNRQLSSTASGPSRIITWRKLHNEMWQQFTHAHVRRVSSNMIHVCSWEPGVGCPIWLSKATRIEPRNSRMKSENANHSASATSHWRDRLNGICFLFSPIADVGIKVWLIFQMHCVRWVCTKSGYYCWCHVWPAIFCLTYRKL